MEQASPPFVLDTVMYLNGFYIFVGGIRVNAVLAKFRGEFVDLAFLKVVASKSDV